MFDFVQKHKKIAQVFLALIAITFMTWGIESYTRMRGGRDAFHKYSKDSVAMNKSWRDMAVEIVTANGDSFANGATNIRRRGAKKRKRGECHCE